MQTVDINGKTLSNSFNSAINAIAQFVKPKVVITFQDARHLSNVTITTNSSHSNSSVGNLGYFFNQNQVVDGTEYETFSWAVAGAKDNNNKTITANGLYRAMPSSLEDNLKFSWWSSTTSNSAGQFGTQPYIDMSFDDTKINKIKVVTTRTLGQVKSFTLAVSRNGSNTILNNTFSFDTDAGEFEKVINLDDTYSDIDRVLLTIVSTKNPNDYARIVSLSPLYEEDITDYVISTDTDRVRDLHETSLPIAGTSQSSASISIDNSSKKFNFLNTSSEYGKYLNKDIKVEISHGWKSYESNNITVQTFLTSNITTSSTTLYVNNASEFPNGDTANTGLVTNYYIITINKGKTSEEKILVSKKTDNLTLEVAERGYGNTTASAASVDDTVDFDPFEYVPMGTFFVEDISSNSDSMTVDITLQDRMKFLNDKTLQFGFFRESTTVGDAVKDLLLLGNFPNHKFKSLNRFQDSPVVNNGILHFKFNDNSNNGTSDYITNGLRLRVYQPPPGFEFTVKDMQIDAYEKQLSDLDKALGLKSSITPSFITTKSNVSLSGYALSSDSASLKDTYYQGVFDGYYVPISSGTDEEIGIEIDEGGARLFIDDNLVIDGWNESTSATYFSSTYTFTAGLPYKIRLEFYHTVNNFDLNFTRGAGRTVIDSNELVTSVIIDSIGSRNPGLTGTNKNKNRNNAIPSIYVDLVNASSMTWNTEDRSIYISNTIANTSVVDSFIRLPHDSSWDLSNSSTNTSRSWTIETIIKSPNGALGGTGEYISKFANSSPNSGFELFYTGSTNHGVKIGSYNSNTSTYNGLTILSSSTAMPNSTGWNHIVVSYNHPTKRLCYFVNGVEHANTTINSNSYPVWGSNDLCFGGRAVSFTDGVGVAKPTSSISNSGINFYYDEFALYDRAMSSDEILNRYIETQITEIKKFPFLYGINESIYQTIQNISFADLGRLYIDENDFSNYEHAYALFESSIDQHANVQKTISDTTFIKNATVQKNLQVNSVIVKVSGVTSNSIDTQPVWRAPDPTTLGVVNLTTNISNSANSIPASDFSAVPFPKSGYIVIDDEIIKYSNTNNLNFLSAERGVLGTTAASHNANTPIREVRYFNFEFDKIPCLNVKNPFITGILFEDPDQINILHWSSSPFKGNLIISASETVDSNTVVFAEGTNPVTQKVSFTSIAGVPIQINENKGQIIEQKAINSDNRRKYGLKEVIIESPFITNTLQAQLLADFIISKLSEPIPIIEVITTLLPTIQVGDRIRITTLDQFDIINSDYWVISVNRSVGSGFEQRMTLRKVV